MFLERFQELAAALESCSYTTKTEEIDENQAIAQARDLLMEVKNEKGIVYVIGNGGSAGIASHFCIDLLKSLHIPAQTLYDLSVMSCISNDLGYEYVFSYPLSLLLKPNDLLVAISSSGKSANILNGVKSAQNKGVKIITLTGFEAYNPLRREGDLNFWIDRSDYGLVETGHSFLLHTLIDLWKPAKAVCYA